MTPGRHRSVQPERRAERVRLAALPDRGRVAERGRDERRRRLLGADHGDVVLGLGRHDVAGRFRPVGERELDRLRAVDDVEAREDVAGERHDDAAAEPGALFLCVLALDAGRLDEDERRLDGLVHGLREGRRRRHRGEGAGDRRLDVLLRRARGRGVEEAVHEDDGQGDDRADPERGEVRGRRASTAARPAAPRARRPRVVGGRRSDRWRRRCLGHPERPRGSGFRARRRRMARATGQSRSARNQSNGAPRKRPATTSGDRLPPRPPRVRPWRAARSGCGGRGSSGRSGA